METNKNLITPKACRELMLKIRESILFNMEHEHTYCIQIVRSSIDDNYVDLLTDIYIRKFGLNVNGWQYEPLIKHIRGFIKELLYSLNSDVKFVDNHFCHFKDIYNKQEEEINK